MNRGPGPLAVAVATLVAALGGCDRTLDTRECARITASGPVTIDCDDLRGVVTRKTTAGEGTHNPSLIVTRSDRSTVRVWLKKEFWDTYRVGGDYP